MRVSRLISSTMLVLVVLVLVGLLTFSVSAEGSSTYDFSNFTEADSMAFVEDHDINIPVKLQESAYLSVFTQELILQSYEAPNNAFCFNYPETQAYAEAIRAAVKNYINPGAAPMTVSTTSYSLLYNTVQDANGNWVTSGGVYKPKWQYYNCYAFSINRAEQPSFYSTSYKYQPGDMSNAGSFFDCSNIDELAEIIRADLVAMGYSNISLSTFIPTIDSSQELICVKMMYDADYHLMRYDMETNAWYHKPGGTAVLKYNYVPTNDRIWYSEYCDATGTYPSNYVYDSPIVYIAYSKNQIDADQNSTFREYIEPEKDVFCEIIVGSSPHYDINLKSDYPFEYEIYDNEFEVVSSGSGTSIDTCLTTFTAGKYFLRMNFTSYAQLHYIDVSIESHSHSYSAPHTWISFTQHESTCCCGATKAAAHVVAEGSFSSGNKYATCLICRGLAMSGLSAMSVEYLSQTANGSYILPNGTIVLVPEDVDAYVTGTLVFRVKDFTKRFSKPIDNYRFLAIKSTH